MADNTLNIAFTTDVSGLKTGVGEAQSALESIFANISAFSARTDAQLAKSVQGTGALYATLQKSMDSAIAGMMKGTEGWHQATLKIISDMEIKFVQMSANLALNFAKDGAMQLASFLSSSAGIVAANDEKNALINASDATAGKAGGVARAQQVIKQIEADAAATYAGVYAYMSPVLGPAAAVPAGISAGAVAAMEGLVSLDVGAWNLGTDMVAQLHKGEMVVPQTFAQGLRDGSGLGASGGGSYAITINAIDTQTGAQFLRDNAPAIASALSSQVRRFNGSVPFWKG